MSKLLLDSQPLIIIPELATKIGLNEAIVLQQLHYWLEINRQTKKNYRNGYYWVYNTYEEWQKQFPWWSIITIKRIFASLEKPNKKKDYGSLVVSDNHNRLGIDRTKWYRIDYKELESLVAQPKYQNDTSIVSICSDARYQYDTTITRDYTETTTETTKKHKGQGICSANPCVSFDEYLKNYSVDDEDRIEAVNYYLDTYEKYRHEKHPDYKPEQWEKVLEEIFTCSDEERDFDLSLEDIRPMINQHFRTRYQEGCNYQLLHFVQDGVLVRRMYEVAY